MEDKKTNIIATIIVIILIIIIIISRVSLDFYPFIVIVSISVTVIIAIFACLFIRRKYNLKNKVLETRYRTEGRELRIEYSFLRRVAGLPTKFSYKEIEDSTNNFRVLVGQGASASVFKGVLSDGTLVAVKRIDREESGDKEFRSEVSAIASVQHVNLVRLLGYCSVPEGYRYLVYDFIPNGSLDCWIFPKKFGIENGTKHRKWTYFPKFVNEKMRERKFLEIIDERLLMGGNVDENEVKKLVYVAMWCIQEKVRLRPSMSLVLEMLEGRVLVDEPPETQMIVVDLLSIDDDDVPQGQNRPRIVAFAASQRELNTVPSIGSYTVSIVSPSEVDVKIRPKLKLSIPPLNELSVIRSVLLSPIEIGSLVCTFSRGFKMSFTGPSSMATGSTAGARVSRRTLEFGRTFVVRPKGKHQATVVWLHGLGDNGSSWSQLLEGLPLPNIKWICPTAPTQPITVFGGFPSTAWFDVGELSEDAADDIEGLDAAATHVANLLSNEPADSLERGVSHTVADTCAFTSTWMHSFKLGVGGFSMGAATSLYSATCFARGKFGNSNNYSTNLSAVVGLSGWLPCAKTLQIAGDEASRAANLPILLCHGKGDDVVPYRWGEKSSQKLKENGFQNMTFKSYNSLGHYTIPEEMDEVCSWLTSKLGLDGSTSQ
ncbi:hypothetical protein ACFE04_009282 [Oxalis oulophora]